MKRAIWIAGVALLAACGSEAEGDQAAAGDDDEERTKVLVVEYVDAIPMDVYSNLDDVKCFAAAAADGSTAEKPQVAVRNSGGAVIGLSTPHLIVDATADGCSTKIRVILEEVDSFYEVTVTGPEGYEKSANVKDDGESEQAVTIVG